MHLLDGIGLTSTGTVQADVPVRSRPRAGRTWTKVAGTLPAYHFKEQTKNCNGHRGVYFCALMVHENTYTPMKNRKSCSTEVLSRRP